MKKSTKLGRRRRKKARIEAQKTRARKRDYGQKHLQFTGAL